MLVDVVDVPVTFCVEEVVFGGPKKDVSVPCLGFFASDVGTSEALRLRDMVRVRMCGNVWEGIGRRKIVRRDSLNECEIGNWGEVR